MNVDVNLNLNALGVNLDLVRVRAAERGATVSDGVALAMSWHCTVQPSCSQTCERGRGRPPHLVVEVDVDGGVQVEVHVNVHVKVEDRAVSC